jgi:predicted DNA-binding transcriptional regulator AlpA
MKDDIIIRADADPMIECERANLVMALRHPALWTLFVRGHVRPAAAAAEPSEPAPGKTEDRLLDAKETAGRLGYSVDWLYRNSRHLPFARHVGRGVRFSESGLNRFIKSRDAAGRKGA